MSAQGPCLCTAQQRAEENKGVKSILRLVTILFAFIGFVREIVFKASDFAEDPSILFFSPQAITCVSLSN